MNQTIQYPKYYAFDWDDNLLYMPTKIILLENGEEVEIGTQKFAEIRGEIGKGIYELLNNNQSFKNFGPSGDEQFIEDAMSAQEGPSWKVFTHEVINKAKIFSIITARAHSKDAFKKIVSRMIKENHKGIDKEKFKKNMVNYLKSEQAHYPERNIVIRDTIDWLIDKYMGVNQFYPVANPDVQKELNQDGGTLNPEEAKVQAYIKLYEHITEQSSNVYAVGTQITPIQGMSDDDNKNLELFRKFMESSKASSSILHYLWDTSNGDLRSVPIKK